MPGAAGQIDTRRSVGATPTGFAEQRARCPPASAICPRTRWYSLRGAPARNPGDVRDRTFVTGCSGANSWNGTSIPKWDIRHLDLVRRESAHSRRHPGSPRTPGFPSKERKRTTWGTFGARGQIAGQAGWRKDWPPPAFERSISEHSLCSRCFDFTGCVSCCQRLGGYRATEALQLLEPSANFGDTAFGCQYFYLS
jgi:hypothetical protein